uniref:PTHB1 N-terminal domain-containing protein n=1 Tax=Ditylenchus dipsaci TaxID=166011 RepID=A0A915EB74_9BILA
MSLFHVQEWYNNIISGARSMAIAQLVDYRDQLVIGSLEGLLTVLDPGRDLEHRQEMSVIVEQQLGKSILQVSIGNSWETTIRVSGEGDCKCRKLNYLVLIAALLPRSLLYFRLLSNEEESYRLEQIFEHKLPGEIAYNMCQGHFGRSHITQICVQSINGSLWVFDGENRALHRRINDCLHPGPIEYTTFSESMLLTSGGYLSSIRYNMLTTTTGAGGPTKKLNVG